LEEALDLIYDLITVMFSIQLMASEGIRKAVNGQKIGQELRDNVPLETG
jgi:hypothetical protein